jgi:hypothetical protein
MDADLRRWGRDRVLAIRCSFDALRAVSKPQCLPSSTPIK